MLNRLESCNLKEQTESSEKNGDCKKRGVKGATHAKKVKKADKSDAKEIKENGQNPTQKTTTEDEFGILGVNKRRAVKKQVQYQIQWETRDTRPLGGTGEMEGLFRR